jgi:hypothetical protein
MPRIILFACVPLLLLVAPSPVMAQTTTPTLVGSWEFTATPETTSYASPHTIEGLATFTSDGTAIETDTTGILGRVSPGHGIWQNGPIPGGYFFVRFTSLLPNLNGTLHSKQILTMFLTLNSTDDEFSGPYDFQIVNAGGDIISNGKGTVAGKLMVHPLLP